MKGGEEEPGRICGRGEFLKRQISQGRFAAAKISLADLRQVNIIFACNTVILLVEIVCSLHKNV